MEKISKLWFDDNRIYIRTDGGKVYSRPLEAFPVLKSASKEARNDFAIARDGDAVRWEGLDEDIHISSFHDTTEPNPDNEIARIFSRFPVLNISEVARAAGMSETLLARYIYGMKLPSEARKMQIRNALHKIGKELVSV